MKDLTYAQLADKYRNQRDVLAECLVAIVKADADGKGYLAKMAQEALERMTSTNHEECHLLGCVND